MSDCRLDALLDFLYLAAIDAAAWPEFLAATARLFNLTVVGFLAQSTPTGRFAITGDVGLTQATTQLSNDYYGSVNPWCLAFRERKIMEWIGPGSSLCPTSRFSETEFYNDYWKSSAPAWFQAGIIYTEDASSSSVLTLHRDHSQGDFEEEDIRLLRELYPHLKRALAIHRKLLDLNQSLASAGGIIDALDVSLIGLKGGRVVCFTNTAADCLLRTADVLSLQDGRLVTRDPKLTASLNAFIDAASSRIPGRLPGGGLTVHGENRSLHITVVPMAGTGGFAPDQTKVFVTVTDPAAKPRSREQLLTRLFQLTPSETRVVSMLIAGLSPNETAERTNTTAGTVRFQLKMIYRKAGVTRQSQLVRLVSMLPGIAQPKSVIA